ncbi:MAG: proline--tRNA ligase [Chloroflexota bacterium]
MSGLFGSTLREAPAGTEAVSHQLLLRAGFIRPLGQGLFSYLPLGRRSLTKLENILREEMNAIGGQEMTMPVAQPADIWKTTGRWSSIGPELARFRDRRDRDMVLALSHEEVVADLCRTEIRSYRQLPRLVYHIQTKFRDDPRPRAGLIRVREFTMKDSYSLDADDQGLEKQYQAHFEAYFRIFRRFGLVVIAVGADVGMMGGSGAHEYMYLTPVGEDTLVLCAACGYSANRQIARFRKPLAAAEEPLPLQRVATPGASTIQELAEQLNVPPAKTAKVVFMMANQGDAEQLVLAVIRGDLEVNETKLAHVAGARDLRPATEAEIRALGAVPGYASPIGLPDANNALVVLDDSVTSSPNLAAGANEEGWHYRDSNVPRDYTSEHVADIANARAGDACPTCGAPLRLERGVEVGNIFKLGTRYSKPAGANFLDASGSEQPVVMGSYGIGVGRALACIAEQHHDDHGLCWPVAVAPYQVHLVRLRGSDAVVAEAAERIYQQFQAAGVEVLYDDRDEPPGVQFADADLIGVPLRLTVSGRSLSKGGIEVKLRTSAELRIVPEAELLAEVHAELARLSALAN